MQGLSDLSYSHPIPRSVREHGWAVDPDDLRPGDLVLVSKKSKNWISRQVVAKQSRLFLDEHARWHHVAVSGGRFEICEATLLGVKAYEYWEYMTGEYEVKVRRLSRATEAERALIAYYAATNVRVRYGFLTAFGIGVSLVRHRHWDAVPIRSTGVICSQLYFEACMRVGYLLTNNKPESVSPAHLSMSTLLEDVDVRRVRV